MSRTLPLGSIRAVPVRIGFSWLLVMPLVGVALYAGSTGSASVPTRAILATAGTVALFGSVLLHEIGHVVAAQRVGVAVHGVVLFGFGGYTEMEVETTRPRDEVTVAAAGPAVSAALAVVCWAISVVPVGEAARVLRLLTVVNGGVALFNLLPGFPLDGGRIARSLLVVGGMAPRRAATATAWAGVGIGAALVVAGYLGDASGRHGGLVAMPVGLMLAVLAWAARPPGRRTSARTDLDPDPPEPGE